MNFDICTATEMSNLNISRLFYLRAENKFATMKKNAHIRISFFRCTKRKKACSYPFYSLLSLTLSITYLLIIHCLSPPFFYTLFSLLQTHTKRLITYFCSFLFPLSFTHAIFTSIHSRKKKENTFIFFLHKHEKNIPKL